MSLLENKNISYYSKVLDVLAQRHRVIANNIANANTPGYRAKDIEFKDVLSEIVDLRKEQSSPSEFDNELQDLEVKEVSDNSGFDNNGINDVDLYGEMAKLSTNTLLYKAYAQLMIMRLKQINLAIKER